MRAFSVVAPSCALACALACALVTVAAPAWGQDAREQARKAYQEGTRLSGERKFADAARAFAEADAALPNDTALEGALEAALLADDPVLGMTLHERTRRTPSAQELAATRKVHAAFASRAAAIEVPCLDEMPRCSATIDGAPPIGRRTWLSIGSHRVVLRRDAREQADSITLAAGAVQQVLFREPAPASAPAPAPAPAPTPAPVDTDDGGISPWWFVGGCGITAALGGITLGHGLASSSNKGEFDDAVAADAPRSELKALADIGASLETRTNIFLVGTVVAVAATAGIGLFLVDWDGGDSGGATALIVPDGDGGARLVTTGTF